MSDFFRVCHIDDINENSKRQYLINDVEIVVIKKNNKFYVLNNVCPHQHASVLHDGFLEDDCIVCPAHGWKFDIETGKKDGAKRGIEKYETKIIDNYLYAKVFEKELNWNF